MTAPAAVSPVTDASRADVPPTFPGADAVSAEAPDPATRAPTPAMKWTGYLVVLGFLLGMGFLFAWPPLRPAFLIPEWMWWFSSGAHGEAYFIGAVILGAGMAQEGADVLLRRGWRVIARGAVLLAIVALAGLAVLAYQHERTLLSLVAALMASVGPLARRAMPGLPHAQARIRRGP
jgi:hypothetical protein